MANKGVNKVIIIGNVGQTPEIKTFKNGGSITNVSVATSESWKDKITGQNMDRTEWHKLVFTGKLSELALNYIKKGSKIYIEGSLKTRSWKDDKGGSKSITEIIVSSFQILDGKRDDVSPNAKESYSKQAEIPVEAFDDEIPF